MSPTIFREGSYQFIIYANDHVPPHVHVRAAGRRVRVKLEPVESLDNDGFNQAQLRLIIRLVREHRSELLQAWNDFHPLGRREL